MCGNGTISGPNNTSVGALALRCITSGSENVMVGYYAGLKNSTASGNSFFGTCAGYLTTTGVGNVAIGQNALDANTTDCRNTAVGGSSLGASIGRGNTALGYESGKNIVAGGGNLVLGSTTPDGSYSPPHDTSGSENNRIVLGSTTSTNAYIKIDWTVTSDLRDKTNIENVPHGLNFINQITPIKYDFKTSREDETPNGTKKYGFSAQEILTLEGDNPIIINNEDTNALKMTNSHLIPVLVNAIKELSETNKDLKSRIEALESN
jgi:hypothetical protein